LGTPKVLESQHRPSDAFDKSVILFDNVVEIFTMPNLNLCIALFIISGDASFIGTAFVNINQARRYIGANRFIKKT
jgi:hypothetical protein